MLRPTNDIYLCITLYNGYGTKPEVGTGRNCDRDLLVH